MKRAADCLSAVSLQATFPKNAVFGDVLMRSVSLGESGMKLHSLLQNDWMRTKRPLRCFRCLKGRETVPVAENGGDGTRPLWTASGRAGAPETGIE